MTKADIIESVYEKVGLSKKEANTIVELVFETIKSTLEQGEKVKNFRFGQLVVRQQSNSRVVSRVMGRAPARSVREAP